MILQRKVNYLTHFLLNSARQLITEAVCRLSSCMTDKFSPNITISSDDILKIIQNLDSEKAHVHDRISIRMLMICGPSICKPLEIIFKACLESGIFPIEWKKSKCCSSS